MIFHIKHSTFYRYSRLVFCEPTTIRLRPREDSTQRLKWYQLRVDPEPVGLVEHLDLEGSVAARIWFDRPLTNLLIVMSCTVETLQTNPYDFLLEPHAATLPIAYAPALRESLSACLSPPTVDAARDTAARFLQISESAPVPFLTQLSQWVHDEFRQTVRDEGEPLPVAETFARREGACRDLVVLFNEVCRAAGLAARFVSGYHADPDPDGQRHLHAWSEVYLPGAGWRGFDPAAGLAVADRHVALCAAPAASLTVPVVGSFRGDAMAVLETQLVISTEDKSAEHVSGAA